MSKCVSPLRQSVQREEVENSSTHVSAVFAVSELTRVACFGELRKALAQRFRQCAARGGIGDGNAERRAVRRGKKMTWKSMRLCSSIVPNVSSTYRKAVQIL